MNVNILSLENSMAYLSKYEMRLLR
jgi:hypothetical protein